MAESTFDRFSVFFTADTVFLDGAAFPLGQLTTDVLNLDGEVLTEIDRSAFAAYCQSYARWKEAQEHINSEGATYETENGMQRPNPWVAICNTEQRLMMQAASEFGLTPSARSRIMAASGVGKDDEDEMEALLGGEA